MTVPDASPVQFWDINDETFNEKDVCSINHECYIQPWICDDDIVIPMEATPGQPYMLEVFDTDNFSGSSISSHSFSEIASGIYRAAFDLSAVCGNKTRFKISLSGTPLMKSDIQYPMEAWDCTTLITYSNSKYYAGIDYLSGTPTPELNLRIPAIFFEESFPDEHEEIDLSDSQSVRLLNIEKRQKKLDIGWMPFYMHKKMKLVLSHDTIEIDGDSWIRSEPYEITESNKRWPLRKSTVVLNDKNYIVRNVL